MSNDKKAEIVYDVVIVGAGISGATTAKTVADYGGKRILILEAGRNTGMSSDKYHSHVLAYHQAMAKVPNSPYADNPNAMQPSELSVKQLITPREPGKVQKRTFDDNGGYMVQAGPLPFSSSYTRALGGTTLHWLGTSLRMLPNDFKLRSKYGHGVDWPITYNNLKPYYERAEKDIIGVAGNVASQTLPGIDKSYFGDYEYPMEEIPSSYFDRHLAKKLNGKEVNVQGKDYEIRISNSPAGRNSTPRKDPKTGEYYRPVGAVGNASQGHRCEGNSSCIPICPVQAKYNALKTLSALQRAHSRYTPVSKVKSSVEIRTQSVATKIELDESGRVSGIVYKQYQNESSPEATEHVVRAKVYVLAAHAIENATLLLASGVANSSRQVGRNLMDHPLILTWGLLPKKVWSYRGPGSTSGIPTFRDGAFRKKHTAFRVEIGNWGWSFAANAPYSTFDTMVDGKPKSRLFGRQLRNRMADVLPRQFRMAWEMEQIPEESNTVSIDSRYLDVMGNYRPIINYDLPDYVRAGMEAARDASRQVFAKLGVKPLYLDKNGEPSDSGKASIDPNEFPYGRDYTFYRSSAAGYLTYGGKGYAFEGAGHVAGTHRMGISAGMSVLNKHQQSWDHENLFMVGCGNMPTLGTANPTLTMTALAIQAGENINKYLEGKKL